MRWRCQEFAMTMKYPRRLSFLSGKHIVKRQRYWDILIQAVMGLFRIWKGLVSGEGCESCSLVYIIIFASFTTQLFHIPNQFLVRQSFLFCPRVQLPVGEFKVTHGQCVCKIPIRATQTDENFGDHVQQHTRLKTSSDQRQGELVVTQKSEKIIIMKHLVRRCG